VAALLERFTQNTLEKSPELEKLLLYPIHVSTIYLPCPKE
jgi:hypothetical protein